MSHGGSDCCGTCWFNTRNLNQGEEEADLPAYCSIRKIEIERPFWTYCANHPHHNPDRVQVPVGPVYINDGSYPNTRTVWLHSPDSPALRDALVEVLEQIPEVPPPEYPFGKPFVEEVIHQLIAFHEKRAIPGLMHILSFDPLSSSEDNSPFRTTRIGTVALAVEALASIGGSASLPGWQHFVTIGRPEDEAQYYAGEDKLAVVRYHAVRGLRFCDGEEAMRLLKHALTDPHEEVRVFAEEALTEKVGTRGKAKVLQEVHGKTRRKRNWWKIWDKSTEPKKVKFNFDKEKSVR
ncbi:MAG: HEAT repeat domain-containing protein [Bacteroidota bacterium]